MTNCTKETMSFSPLSRKKVLASFCGGSITSNAGILLFREIDRELGLSKRIATLIPDSRNPLYQSNVWTGFTDASSAAQRGRV